MDSNTVQISGPMINSITFVTGSVVVTPGVPYCPTVKITESDNNWELVLQADREGSSTVADSFNTVCGGASNEFCPTAAVDTTPEALNFYFGVNILVNVPNMGTVPLPGIIYLGQGHTLLHNNWWIGGQAIGDVTNGVNAMITVVEGGVTVMTIEIEGGVSNFNFMNDSRA